LVRKDFVEGGFQVNSTSPVICFTNDGTLHVAYDNSSLKNIIVNNNIVNCVGVWPGKMNTDCFPLNVKAYGKKAPPEGYAEIDNCTKITLNYQDGKLANVTYVDTDGIQVVAESKELADYIIDVGLNHKVVRQ